MSQNTNPIPVDDRVRIQDAAGRLRHNLSAFLDDDPKLYHRHDTPKRHRRYSYSNYLSSIYSIQDVICGILAAHDRAFKDAVTSFVQSDELLWYLRASRNAEDHAPRGVHSPGVAGEAPAYTGFNVTSGQLVKGPMAFVRQPFKLPTVVADGQNRTRTVLQSPRTHLGQPLPDDAPATALLAATAWWLALSDNVRNGRFELPGTTELAFILSKLKLDRG